MLDNEVLNMTPGEALLDIPMSDIIQRMAVAIAEAQVRLDQMSIQIAVMMGDTRLDMRAADGTIVSRSLLELGFTPSFYHFTETNIDVRVSLSIRVTEEFSIGAALTFGTAEPPTPSGTGATGAARGATGAARPAGPTGATGASPAAAATTGATAAAGVASTLLGGAGGGGQRASAFGLAVNVEYSRKYGFDTTASSAVTTKLVSVPPPTVFMNALRQSFGLQLGTP